MTIRIEQALNKKLNDFAESFNIFVEWDFYSKGVINPPAGIHLRQSIIPSETTIVGMENSGSNSHTGIYQILVCGGSGNPSIGLKERVEEILDLFSRGQLVEYNGVKVVIENTSKAAPIYSESYVKVPVSIRYRSFIGNG